MRICASGSSSESQREVREQATTCIKALHTKLVSLWANEIVIISYLDQILAENQRLREQSVTSAQVAEANDPTHSER
jgi:hypothetical protein